MLFGALFIFFLLLSFWYQKILIAFIPFSFLLVLEIIKKPLLLFYLLLFSLPLSTEYKFTETLGTDFPDEFIMIAASALFILMFVYDPFLIRKKQLNQLLFALLLIHFAWMTVCSMYSTNILLSVKYCLAKGWYFISFVMLPLLFLKTKRTIRIALACLLFPMLLIAILSMVRHAGVGFSFEKINNTLTPFFRNHVNYGAMLVCMLPVTVAWIYLNRQKRMKYLAMATLLLLSAALFLSFSRGAWLAVLVAAIAVWAVKRNIIQWLITLCFFSVIIAAAWMLNNNRYIDYRPDFKKTIFHTDFQQHLSATYRGQDLSTAERFYRWTAVRGMLLENPVTGVGPNNFYDNYKPYTTSVFKTYVSDNPEHSTVHNYFLLLLAEQGIPGLLSFLALLIGMFWHAQKIYHTGKDTFYQTAALTISAVLAMIVTLNFLSDLIETDKIGSLFFLCLGLLIVINELQAKQKVD